MEFQSQPPAKIVLRLQESPGEYLEVTAAFAKQPDIVREALLEAIRHVQLHSSDITLLQIEAVFRSTLQNTWKEPKVLRPVLEACRQGKLKSRTESLFFEHGEEYGVVALCAATKHDDHRLFREIDALRDEELIRLIKNVNKIPKKASIVEFIEEFGRTPNGIVPDPPPQLTRPRSRKRGNFTPTGDSRSQSPPVMNHAALEIHQSNKRRRPNLPQVPPGDGQQCAVQTHLRLPSPHEAGLSALYDFPPKAKNISSSQRLPVQQSYHQLSYYKKPSSYLSQSNTLNRGPSHRACLGQLDTANPSQSQFTTQLIHFEAGTGMQQPSEQEEPMIQLDDIWHIPGREFISGRPPMFDGQASQMLGQEEWDIPGREFIPGRPPMFDGQTSQIPAQVEEWDIPASEFIPGRPLMFDGQASQVQGQGENWDIPGSEFIPGRPPMFDGQTSQMLGQGEDWDIPGREFIPGRPLMLDGQALQMPGQGEEWEMLGRGRGFVPSRPHIDNGREPQKRQDEF